MLLMCSESLGAHSGVTPNTALQGNRDNELTKRGKQTKANNHIMHKSTWVLEPEVRNMVKSEARREATRLD